jgi:hypothetical protein
MTHRQRLLNQWVLVSGFVLPTRMSRAIDRSIRSWESTAGAIIDHCLRDRMPLASIGIPGVRRVPDARREPELVVSYLEGPDQTIYRKRREYAVTE